MEKNKCLDKIEDYNRIIIYGAGKIGKRILSILKDNGFSEKIVCFAISDRQVEEVYYNNFPVKSIYDLESEYKKALFILAVSEKFMPDIELLLKGLNVDNYTDGRELYLQGHTEISINELFVQQNRLEGYNRFDIIVRYLAIENYYNENNYGFELYEKMQGQRVSLDYIMKSVEKFKKLIDSWNNSGYRRDSEIECDRELHLVDGSHRMALCLYFKVETISCKVRSNAENINYGIDWFLEHGFTLDEIKLMQAKCDELMKRCYKTISCILWPPVYKYFDEITEKIKVLYDVKNVNDYSFKEETFLRAVKGIYHIDDIETWKIDKKIQYMRKYKEKTIRILELMLPVPKFRLKDMNNKTLSAEGEKIKKIFRSCYKDTIEEYFYDIIMHTGDNYDQSEYITGIFKPAFSLEQYFIQVEKYGWILVKRDSEAMPDDFPKSYPFSKDVDLFCISEDYEKMVEDTILYLNGVCLENYEINVQKEMGRTQIRLECGGYLIFLFDITKEIKEMNKDFIKKAISNGRMENGYKVPDMEDELVFRAYEFIKYPEKIRHMNYIKKNKSSWNLIEAKKALPFYIEQLEEIDTKMKV